jgi:hypothetical protein
MDTYSTGSTITGKTSSGKEMGAGGKDMSLAKNRSRKEDSLTSTIEQATAKVPSVAFLAIALGAIVGSLGLFFAGKKHASLLMAAWVPTVLILGNYNKVVKASENIQGGGMEAGSFGGGSTGF